MGKLIAVGKSIGGTILLGIGLALMTVGTGMVTRGPYEQGYGFANDSFAGFVFVLISLFFIPVGIRIIAKA